MARRVHFIPPVRINHQVVSSTTKSAVLAFIFLYMAIIFIGWLIMAIRIHFIPPVVDPAQAPNNMMMHINVQSTGTQVI